MGRYSAEQNDIEVWAAEVADDSAAITDTVPGEWLDNVQVAATTVVKLDGEIISVVEPYDGV